MSLFLVFVLLTAGFTALFMGVSVVVQGYLYQEPAPRLPIRALVGGILLAGFLTMWTAIDKSKPGRYDTFFNFAGYSTVEFKDNEFEAVRWPIGPDGNPKTENGKDVEVLVKFKRGTGGKTAPFVREGTNETFMMTGTDPNGMRFMTGALRVKGPNDPDYVRYNALLIKDTDERRSVRTRAYSPERRFDEEKGSRYVNEQALGTIFVPSTGTVVVALLLNFSLLLVWQLVLWPVLRYSFLHALGITAVGALATMLVLMPLLFNFNRPKAAPAPAATAPVFKFNEPAA